MNAEFLYHFANKLMSVEREYSGQSKLEALNSSLQALAGAPQDGKHQSNFYTAIQDARTTFKEIFLKEFDGSEVRHLDDIGALDYFSGNIVAEVQTEIAANPMAPSVVQKTFQNRMNERQNFLQVLEQLTGALDHLGIGDIELEDGEVQAGFSIPREIFGNSLDGFLKELSTIRFLVNSVSIVVEGKPAELVLGDLSSSNPLVFLGLPGTIAFAVAASITWGLNTWIQVEKIREFRESATEVEALSSLTQNIDEIIEREITAAIEARAAELSIGVSPKPEEIEAIKKSHRILLERLERGLTFELRYVAPEEAAVDSSENADGDSEETQSTVGLFEQLDGVRSAMHFPSSRQKPILQLSFPSSKELK